MQPRLRFFRSFCATRIIIIIIIKMYLVSLHFCAPISTLYLQLLTTTGDRCSLEHLYISDCELRVIQPGAFSDLVDLRWLDLSDNLIETITDSTFAGLRLGHLFLNGNRGLVLVPGSFGALSVSGLYM